jgi:trehalose 6-phosphate synthase/phosphatase
MSEENRMLVVAHMLPLNAKPRADGNSYIFDWDKDSLLYQLKDGLPAEMEVIYVGCLKVEVEENDQEEVAAFLLENFNCVPAFLSPDLRNRFYHGFCKQMLWPLFHYLLPLSPEHGGRFNRSWWQAYVSVNKIFADKVMEVITPDDDFVWVHDYHLMVLPTFLRKRFNKVKLGFFLHSPFPSSEIYRTLPVRDEILRALLNADLIGFHTFDYARHFLSCCSRMLGLEYASKRGNIGLEYYGRTVGIKIMPVGIHKSQFDDILKMADTKWRIGELKEQFKGMTVLLGVDDMDIFKGIGLKFLAMEELLKQHKDLQGKVVMIQIANPARGTGKDIQEAREEAYSVKDRVNEEFGNEHYEPIVLLERVVPLFERIAYYTIADCCVVIPVRDGLNLIPYEYIVCREGAPELIASANYPQESIVKRSMLIVSEFIGCSPSLSGAIRVNPWNIEMVAEAMNSAITMKDSDQHLRHEKHYKYVSIHDVAYWSRSYMVDLERTCQDHSKRRCYGIGFGLGFRVVALDPTFKKLRTELIVAAYKKSHSRALLLDYDGTVMPTSHKESPTPEVLDLLNTLCSDPKNMVFIVSGRPRVKLAEWFEPCESLGLAAEHGYFYRWRRDSEWATCRLQSVAEWDRFNTSEREAPSMSFEWKLVAEPVMQLYTESTDGSYIEAKESALVWHHRFADPDFGSWQAKELQDHLESVLANEPVTVKSGAQIVEVTPQGVSKGVVVEKLLLMMDSGALPDFVLCVGDDRSDEDMFESIECLMNEAPSAEVFACTVGQKPSKAKYYLDDVVEVIKMLQGLANASSRSSASSLPQLSEFSSLHI